MKQFYMRNKKFVFKEFQKGRNYWLVVPKNADDNLGNRIKIIKWMKFKKKALTMEYDSYYLKGDSPPYYKQETSFIHWNFDGFKFYVLSKKEALRYQKEIMMLKLSSRNNENNENN